MTRSLKLVGCAAWSALLLAAHPASAQRSDAIPPMTQKQKDERRRENANDTLLQGATSVPGMILEGSKILTQRVDPSSVGSAIKGADLGSSVISYSLTGARIVIGAGSDGWEGFKREGTQAVIEKGFDVAGQAATGLAVRSAVASGAGLGTASGALGISYTAGSVFGSYLRNSVDIGQSLGLRTTIGDEVDSFWFKHTPDSLKELASGTRQVDIDDPAVMQQMRATADRNRRRATFDTIHREMSDQRQQSLQAQQFQQMQQTQRMSAPSADNVSLPPAEGPSDPTLALQGILSLSRAVQAARQTAVAPNDGANSSAVCRLDPKTGCHPGHDEKSHPGGCKKC